MARKMESVLDAYLGGVQNGVAAAVAATSAVGGCSAGDEDIPKNTGPVWILGRKYSAVQGWLNIRMLERNSNQLR